MNSSDSPSGTLKSGSLHPDFKLFLGKWAFNRFWNSSRDGPIAMKVRAAFDDLTLLKGIMHSAKIALNADASVPHAYVLFAYGGKGSEKALRELASRFPYSELIRDTAPQGKQTERSVIEQICPVCDRDLQSRSQFESGFFKSDLKIKSTLSR